MLPDLKYADVNGVRLAYREQGRGKAMVMVHGSLAGLDTFKRQLPAFGRHHHVVTYARRYHPPSGPEGEGGEYTLDLHAEDLHALIISLGIRHPHIVASSYGGYVALRCCLLYPGIAASLTVGEPPMLRILEETEAGSLEFEEFRDGALAPARAAFTLGDVEAGARVFFDGIRGEPGSFDSLPVHARRELLLFARELALELTTDFDRFMPAIPYEELRALQVPVLLLTGGRSPAFFHRITARLEQCIPGARRMDIPGADHSIHTSAPEAYNAAVLAFLTDHVDPRRTTS